MLAVITGAFVALLYGAYHASVVRRPTTSTYLPQTLSNGTSLFAPTTLLISLDGFRADFLHRDLTPTLAAFIRAGVSPKYMLPSFPSVTFPNHFTLVTGLYPESHGVVGNTFWDPDTKKEFWYTDPARSMKPEWWRAEPVWELAEKEGVRSGVHMWPGSEAHIGDVEPTYVDKYNSEEDLGKKIFRVQMTTEP
jgi:predicted AlkP superfamily pyrophosphatase or phosphodiesterase